MARLAEGENDKALWLILAQSWVRLAEHAARAEKNLARLREGEADDTRLPDSA